MPLTMQHPFTCLIAGPTGSGKTQFTYSILRNLRELISPVPEKIVWCYGVWQPSFKDFPFVEFIEGLPNIDRFDGSRRVLLILDDLMHETDETVSQIFTRGSHHKNISIICLTQNLFHSSKHNRTMNLNSHYIVLFKNPRDMSQITYLSRQMYPGKGKFLSEAFEDATTVAYGYLFLDLKADTDDAHRVRTNIFPGETPYVYRPK